VEGLKITLRHNDLLNTKCSAIFMKHIEGKMSTPERALDAVVHGRLQSLHTNNEKEDHSILRVAQGGFSHVLSFTLSTFIGKICLLATVRWTAMRGPFFVLRQVEILTPAQK
jgi:hypothetical protein